MIISDAPHHQNSERISLNKSLPRNAYVRNRILLKLYITAFFTVVSKLVALFTMVASAVDEQYCMDLTNSVIMNALHTSISANNTTRSGSTTCKGILHLLLLKVHWHIYRIFRVRKQTRGVYYLWRKYLPYRSNLLVSRDIS